MYDIEHPVAPSKGIEILKLNVASALVEEGLKIINKNGYDFEKCCDDICYSIEIVDSDSFGAGTSSPIETLENERVIRILSSYASDKKYKWFADNEGFAAHEFFRAFCFAQMDWTRNQRDMYNFFASNDKEHYPSNFEEYVPFSGQFVVMMQKGYDDDISNIIDNNGKNDCFNDYLEIAKSVLNKKGAI